MTSGKNFNSTIKDLYNVRGLSHKKLIFAERDSLNYLNEINITPKSIKMLIKEKTH